MRFFFFLIQMISRIQRVKSLIDRRKKRRSQDFLNHRLRHYLATNDQIHVRFRAICEHLNLIDSYSLEQKFTALLFVIANQSPQITDFIRIEWTSELIDRKNDELNVLVSSVCYILNEITINYPLESKYNISVHFERDNLTFRPNVNSISNLMVELLSRLLLTFSHRCETTKIHIAKPIFDAFELCYQKSMHNRDVMERNLHTILALTHGIGRFGRTKSIVEHELLMQRLMCQHITDAGETLIVLKIIKSITEGFSENIHNLLHFNMLGYLKNQLTVNDTNQPSYELVKEGLCILENVCGNHRSDIQAVIDADLISPLINGILFSVHFFSLSL